MGKRKLDIKKKHSHGEDGLYKFIELCKENNSKFLLDIGCGEEQTHANTLKEEGFLVETNDYHENADQVGDYNLLTLGPYDGIHAAHVLEHQLCPIDFLKKVNKDLYEEGILCITVPPLKNRVVSGHVSLWNAGLVIYNLVLAGFNCSENTHIKQYGYNISIVLKKKSIEKLPKLNYDRGDLTTLNSYFPKNLKYGRDCSFNGEIKEYNW